MRAGLQWPAEQSIVEGEDFQGRVLLRQVFSTDASGVVHVQSLTLPEAAERSRAGLPPRLLGSIAAVRDCTTPPADTLIGMTLAPSPVVVLIDSAQAVEIAVFQLLVGEIAPIGIMFPRVPVMLPIIALIDRHARVQSRRAARPPRQAAARMRAARYSLDRCIHVVP